MIKRRETDTKSLDALCIHRNDETNTRQKSLYSFFFLSLLGSTFYLIHHAISCIRFWIVFIWFFFWQIVNWCLHFIRIVCEDNTQRNSLANGKRGPDSSKQFALNLSLNILFLFFLPFNIYFAGCLMTSPANKNSSFILSILFILWFVILAFKNVNADCACRRIFFIDAVDQMENVATDTHKETETNTPKIFSILSIELKHISQWNKNHFFNWKKNNTQTHREKVQQLIWNGFWITWILGKKIRSLVISYCTVLLMFGLNEIYY